MKLERCLHTILDETGATEDCYYKLINEKKEEVARVMVADTDHNPTRLAVLMQHSQEMFTVLQWLWRQPECQFDSPLNEIICKIMREI